VRGVTDTIAARKSRAKKKERKRNAAIRATVKPSINDAALTHNTVMPTMAYDGVSIIAMFGALELAEDR
jgi:hypothetical protein